MPGKFELFHEGPLFQLKGILAPFHEGPLFQLKGMFGPLFHGLLLPHEGPLFQLNGMFEPFPQPILGPPPHEGPLPILKPLPGPLPHDWLLPQFILGFMSKLSKPQPPALALPAMPAKRMLAIIFFMDVLPVDFIMLIRKQVG